MAYEYITKYDSPNFTRGRRARITGITIHWWGDPSSRPQFSGVVHWLCNPRSRASAHYVVEAGRVACLVACKNTAWHAGPGNASTIGIECNPRMSAADLETVAELIAILRRTYGMLPLYPHSKWMATACPGSYKKQLAWLDRRAREIMADKTQKSPSRAPRPSSANASLVVDGWWGPATTRALQSRYGTPVDGVVSSQYRGNRRYLKGLTSVHYAFRPRGSALIRAIQRDLTKRGHYAMRIDGLIGPGTIRALQRHYGTPVDGSISGPSVLVRAMQRDLNR